MDEEMDAAQGADEIDEAQGQDDPGVAGQSIAEGQGASVEAAPAPSQAQIDWEAEHNPYKQRFTGLQGNFKQVQTERQQAMQRVAELEEAVAISQAVNSGATDEEVQAIRKNWADQKQVAEFLQNVAAQVDGVEKARLALEPAAKEQGLTQIATQMGIERAELAAAVKDAEATTGPLDPRGVMILAGVLSKQKRSGVLEARKKAGTDVFESGGTGGASLANMSPKQKILMGVQESKRR